MSKILWSNVWKREGEKSQVWGVAEEEYSTAVWGKIPVNPWSEIYFKRQKKPTAC